MKQRSGSLSANTYNKLRKNPLGILSFFVIVLAALITIFAYPISSDKTSAASIPHEKIKRKPIGFNQLMIKLPLDNYTKRLSFKEWFLGKEVDYEEIVIDSYQMNAKNQQVEYQEFLGEGLQSETQFIPYKKWTRKGIPQAKIESDFIQAKTFLLGTDGSGRDFYSRLVVGTRISFLIGFIAVLISLIVGVTLGAIGGYYKGWIDNVIMWIINVFWSIPTLLLVIAITLALGKGFWQIFIAVGLTMWVEVARVVRGQVLSYREKEFVEAAKALGFSNLRIIFKEILPNILAPVIVISAANFAAAILIESGLSFLGIGAQPPTPSWGGIIKDNYAQIITGNTHLALLPGFLIMTLVLAFNVFGNSLRDALDIKE